ncbi:unnamed protein product [Paramecium pentaurelia]|uniref:Uncharacterized protein n=1 Tax=Paramecium pentaurelia TaxID=43138 RepID=A0A8S1VC62_9CILI|nr:unnamed protein product [Paramecium pentaurelia]
MIIILKLWNIQYHIFLICEKIKNNVSNKYFKQRNNIVHNYPCGTFYFETFILSVHEDKNGKKIQLMYYPLLGKIIQFKRGLKLHKNILYFEKLIPQMNPEIQVSNTFFSVKYDFFNRTCQIHNIELGSLQKVIENSFGISRRRRLEISQRVLQKSFEFKQLREFTNINEPINIINLSDSIIGKVITQSFFSQSFKEVKGKQFLSEFVDVMVKILTLYREGSIRQIILIEPYIKRSISFQKTARNQRHIECFNQRKIINVKLTSRFFNSIYQYNTDKLLIILEQNPKLTEEHAIQQYMMLIFVGVDKTSNLFGSCCYALAIHFKFQ